MQLEHEMVEEENSTKWSQPEIQQYIDDEVEESTNIEYKDALALGRNPEKKKEIAKDVSAMANANGGIIFYGISEFQDTNKKHKPEKISPVDNTEFSKEWLEHVINDNIKPRIKGLTIYPVKIDTDLNHFVYVVEIPRSPTAHQVTASHDCRYYERLNFEVVRMEDYRVRDAMNRGYKPVLGVIWDKEKVDITNDQHVYRLIVKVLNKGEVSVKNWKMSFTFPVLYDWDGGKKSVALSHDRT